MKPLTKHFTMIGRVQSRSQIAGLLALIALALILILPLESAAKGITPRAERKRLPNGMRLIMVENSELPFVQINLVTNAGSRNIPIGKAGLAEVTARLMLQGAGERAGATFQRHVDSLGAQLTSSTSRERTVLRLSVSRREMIAGLQIIKDILRTPALTEDEFSGVLNRQKSHVLQAYDVGYAIMDEIALETFFPEQSYGAAPMGSPKALEGITLDDVHKFQSENYSPESMTLIVAGDVDAKRLGPEIAQLFASISKSKVTAPPPPEIESAKSRDLRIVLIDAPGSLSASVGFYALASSPTDTAQHAATTMLTHLLGEYPDISFFGRRLVENRNLVSRLKSQLSYMRTGSLIGIEMRSAREHVVDVVAEGLDILRSVSESRISKRELEEGKQFFRGHYALAFECATDVATMFTQLSSVDLHYRYHDVLIRHINSLTQADIRESAKSAFSPDNLVVVVYGDARTFAGDLQDFGRVTHHSVLDTQP